MHSNIHAMGMFIRFSSKNGATHGFYKDTLEFPLIRIVGANVADIYWGGEATVYELVYVADKTVTPETDPAQAPCVPVYRVHDLDGLLASLAAKGVKTFPAQPRGPGREAFIADTDGYLIGLRERGASDLAEDLEAARRARRGETYNPGCKSMPQGVQELGWVVRRVADLAAMTAFYRDVVGLSPIGEEDGHVLFDLGDNSILELAAGGVASPAPTDRYHAPSAFILRVSDIEAVRAAVRASAGTIVNEKIPLHWADLSYFADPEGCVFGAEQGYHPGEYAPEKFILAENLEAERRWREFKATHPEG